MRKTTILVLTRPVTNRAVQAQNMARNLKFKKKNDSTYCAAKTKALISCAVTAKLICAFVFAYADCWLSCEKAHILKEVLSLFFFIFIFFHLLIYYHSNNLVVRY